MYAIVELGGRQWKVEPGTRLEVNRLSAAVGARHTVEHVLLAHDGQRVQLGRPYVPGAVVVCEVMEHRLGPKVITYKYRRRENWRKTVGHRQPLTRLVVKDITLGGAVPASEAAAPTAQAAGKTSKTIVKRRAPTVPSKPTTKGKVETKTPSGG